MCNAIEIMFLFRWNIVTCLFELKPFFLFHIFHFDCPTTSHIYVYTWIIYAVRYASCTYIYIRIHSGDLCSTMETMILFSLFARIFIADRKDKIIVPIVLYNLRNITTFPRYNMLYSFIVVSQTSPPINNEHVCIHFHELYVVGVIH